MFYAAEMKTKTSGNMDKGRPAGRPSLYSFNSGERDSGEIFSILEALEPRRHKGAIWGRAVLFGLVVILACALYLVGRNVDLYRNLSPKLSDDSLIGGTFVRHDEPQQAPPAASAFDAPMHYAELQTTAAPEQPSQETEAPAADNAPVASPVPVPAAGAYRHGEQVAALPHRRESHAAAAGKAPTKPLPGKDSDVDLIAALVAHVSHAESAGREARKNAVRSRAADVRVSAATRKGRSVDASRDVVVRKDEDSTTELVARCRALGLIEGELCRLRICSGLWGSDPACPGAAPSDSASGR